VTNNELTGNGLVCT